jgi:hypothetical protein
MGIVKTDFGTSQTDFGASQIFKIVATFQNKSLPLHDISGRAVASGVIGSSRETLQISHSGVYVLRVNNKAVKVIVK